MDDGRPFGRPADGAMDGLRITSSRSARGNRGRWRLRPCRFEWNARCNPDEAFSFALADEDRDG